MPDILRSEVIRWHLYRNSRESSECLHVQYGDHVFQPMKTSQGQSYNYFRMLVGCNDRDTCERVLPVQVQACNSYARQKAKHLNPWFIIFINNFETTTTTRETKTESFHGRGFQSRHGPKTVAKHLSIYLVNVLKFQNIGWIQLVGW